MSTRADRVRPARAGATLSIALLVTLAALAVDVLPASDGGLTGAIAAAPAGSTAASAGSTAIGARPPSPATVPSPSAQEVPVMSGWPGTVAQSIDSTTLVDAGLVVPYGANVFAARIFGGGPTPAYAFYEAGGGAFADQFYPASSVKLLAALGALDFVGSLGFTGEATIDGVETIHDVYDRAIRYSSNDDYSELVRIAGVARLNLDYLPSVGYGATAIQEAYGGEYEQVAYSPPMTLAEDDRQMDVPERYGYDSYGCGGTNCSPLFDLVDALRRVVLDAEIPAGERFAIAPSDVAGLQDALLGSDSWIAPAVMELFGPDARIYSKPGWVGGLDCVDAALVDDPVSAHRYLIGLSVPDSDYYGCDSLAPLAYDVLNVLEGRGSGEAVRTDGTVVRVADGKQVVARP